MSNAAEQDTYAAWVERMAAGRNAKPLSSGDLVQTPEAAGFTSVEFVQMPRQRYRGEVGRKNGDFIFHFFPKDGEQYPQNFSDLMGDAFLEVFKLEDRVKASFVPELGSWAAIAQGFANNPGSDALALKLFMVLDQKLDP